MKLIGTLTCPYVRKVRVVMAEKKLEYELILEDIWADNSSIQTHNPLGKVPCLLMDDQGRLFDSRVIVEFLDALSPVSRLIPQHARERAATKCWEALADGILEAALAIDLERTQRNLEHQDARLIERQKNKIIAALDSMNTALGEEAFCMGINLSLADLAVGCALAHLDSDFPELNWRETYPNLLRLYSKLEKRPSFENTQPPAKLGVC